MTAPDGGPTRAARARYGLIGALFVVPLALMAGKLPSLPTAELLNGWLSLSWLPAHMQKHVEFVLFVPLGAVVVSFFRLTLGVRVLSLFRPILVAIAFRIIGVPLGLAFLALVVGAVLLLRPLLRGAHYYSRVPVMLSVVAMLTLLPLVLGRVWHEGWLQHLAYFPIISLCLICESFTKALGEKGFAGAALPTVNTILVGMLISAIASLPGASRLLLRFPELLVLQTGVVLFIGEFLHLELLTNRRSPEPSSGDAAASPASTGRPLPLSSPLPGRAGRGEEVP